MPAPFSRLPATSNISTLRRSLGLLADFRFEQSDPDRFYGHLAADTARLVEALAEDLLGPVGGRPGENHGERGENRDEGFGANGGGRRRGEPHRSDARPGALAGRIVLDVGGGPGYFDREFRRRGARYITVEPDVGEMSAAGIEVAASVRGSGTELPFRDAAVDVCYSSNVAEHVPRPWRMGEEMLRVTRPGGLVIMSYTVWLGPFGGHETGLWPHYVGGGYARDRYRRRHGHDPKNVFGRSLFAVSAAAGLRWARATPRGELLAAFPRYHPRWAWWLTRVPGLREFTVSNLVLVLRRRTNGSSPRRDTSHAPAPRNASAYPGRPPGR